MADCHLFRRNSIAYLKKIKLNGFAINKKIDINKKVEKYLTWPYQNVFHRKAKVCRPTRKFNMDVY